MGESSEPRLDFIQEFTLRSLRLKPDKWARMIVFDEQRTFINNFLERGQFCFITIKKGPMMPIKNYFAGGGTRSWC